MWIAKLKLKHNDCPIVNRCENFGIIIFSYPSTWYEKSGKKFATTTCFFKDVSEKKKKEFLKDLKSDKRISKLENSGDRFIYEINLGKKGEHVMLYYTKDIIFTKPVINHFDGYEYWEVASWEKKNLNKFISKLNKQMDISEIMKIEKSNLENIYFPSVAPKLPKKQKEAINLAYNNGYYTYPRKISLSKIAKIAKVGVSTFQEHLRKAELKLLPIIIQERGKVK